MRDTKFVNRRWSPVPSTWRVQACVNVGSILLESSLPSGTEHHSLLFTEPEGILTATSHTEIPGLFHAIDSALAKGRWVAGYVSYEAGTHFLGLPPVPAEGPLASFGIYRAPQTFDHYIQSGIPAESPAQLSIAPMLRTTVNQYHEAIQQIREWIAAGDTYQVNYTTQMQSPCIHTPLEVYQALSAQQPSSYAAIVNFPNQPVVLSLSPELFFRVDYIGSITTLPMKGTAPRGSTPGEDQRLADALQNDEKNRAEHVMIVDLLRNDLNRICRTGTVRAEDLFRIEQYETLHQMTSRVSGTLHPDTSWYQVFRALFPGGSITGAPKRHTAQLIQQVERAPRGVYTGAIGYFAPNRTAAFNIAIRTAVLHRDPDQTEIHSLTIGVGGGIVADSTPASEYTEVMLKADFVRRASQPFGLLETMRAEHGTILFLERHLRRLKASAETLGYRCNTEVIHRELIAMCPHGKVRLHLSHDGETDITVSGAPTWPAELHLAMSSLQTDASSPHLRHKTTFRPEYSRPIPDTFHDTLFQNTRGELTESSIANLLVQIDGRWYTPPLTCGVLPGIMRGCLLQSEQIQERTVTLCDLQRSEAVALCNALRGVAPVTTLHLDGEQCIQWKIPASLPQLMFNPSTMES